MENGDLNPRQCLPWSTYAPTNSTNQWTTAPVFVIFYIDFLLKKRNVFLSVIWDLVYVHRLGGWRYQALEKLGPVF